jgi:xanthine dehydrogenase molybdopterin-binding subunit B
MLAISVREAIRDAVAAFGEAGGDVPLASPATCEAIFMSIRKRTPSAAKEYDLQTSSNFAEGETVRA